MCTFDDLSGVLRTWSDGHHASVVKGMLIRMLRRTFSTSALRMKTPVDLASASQLVRQCGSAASFLTAEHATCVLVCLGEDTQRWQRSVRTHNLFVTSDSPALEVGALQLGGLIEESQPHPLPEEPDFFMTTFASAWAGAGSHRAQRLSEMRAQAGAYVGSPGAWSPLAALEGLS
jgi:hypothetical protein